MSRAFSTHVRESENGGRLIWPVLMCRVTQLTESPDSLPKDVSGVTWMDTLHSVVDSLT